MNDAIYNDMALEQTAKHQFGVHIDIDHVIVRGIAVSPTTEATVLLTTKKQLLVYVDGQARLSLADVKKIINRMGLVAELYYPPKGHGQYFDDFGKERFKETFPGRSEPSPEDIAYYRTLAPYKPALVQILEVKEGVIRQYDRDSASGWRVAAKFAYRRIKTS